MFLRSDLRAGLTPTEQIANLSPSISDLAEHSAPGDREVADQLRETIDRLAAFLGASRVTYTSRVPWACKGSLR